MPKFKSQHPATCWAIDVTQISREGVLGQSDPAIGKGLIGSLQVLRAAAAKRRSSRCNRAPAAPCSSACSLAETRLDAPSRRFHRVCSDYRNPTPTQPRFFTKQNGHLVRAGTLKNSALLTNLICGRGFGSLFRHHLQGLGNSPGPFLFAFPQGSAEMCCGLRGAPCARNGRFPGQSRLHSPFGLRVVAGVTVGRSTTYACQFVVNHGHQSTGTTGPITLVPIEIDDKGNGCGDEGRTVRIGVVDAHDQGRREVRGLGQLPRPRVHRASRAPSGARLLGQVGRGQGAPG